MPGVDASQDEAELERRLAEVDALRKRVLNVIPHALRTPITTFRGLTEALPHANEREVREEIAPALRRLAAQAERLLDDMLLAAGVTTTLPTGEAVGTDVATTAREVWADVGGKGTLTIADGSDGHVAYAPHDSVHRILVHLLDNAARYGDDPTTLRIERSGSGSGGSIEIVVDSPGNTLADDLANIGEPFFRGERAVMLAAGLGVGISVSRALAEHAGGRLDIAARDGGGLTVRVELPAGGDAA